MDVGYSSAGFGGAAGSHAVTPDTVRAEYRGDLGGFGSGSDASGMVWIGFMLIMAVPILFLVLVGLIYELLVRVTRHRLPPMSDWTLSLLAAVVLVAGGLSWAVAR